MLVDIKVFLILSQQNFEELIQYFNCNLTSNSEMYMITYLFTNLMCYLAIFMTVKVALFLYYQFFKSNRKVVRRWDI